MNQGTADIEMLVYDELTDCPYLPEQTARMPLRLPLRALTEPELDQRLAAGDRRSGPFLYQTRCPRCQACEPLRLEVARFEPNRTQRKTLLRGNARLRTEVGVAKVDALRVALYNRHKQERELDRTGLVVDEESYKSFLVASCCTTLEICYFLGERMVAVAVADLGETALSAVYCYFDPDEKGLGLGTYSILKQIELCQTWGKRYLYLGLYVSAAEHLAYKANFLPHERRIDGRWTPFARS